LKKPLKKSLSNSGFSDLFSSNIFIAMMVV
jgi:hypothetical protein